MARGGSKGVYTSAKKSTFNFVWYIIVAGLVVGIITVLSMNDIGSIFQEAKKRSDYLVECVPKFNCNFNGQLPAPTQGQPNVNLDNQGQPQANQGSTTLTSGEPVNPSANSTKDNTLKTLNSVQVKDAQKVNYSRKEWKHWATVGNNPCWTVRKEVLVQQGNKDSLKLVNKDRIETTDKNTACAITAGSWVDPYSGTTITNPSEMDIDHVIPLSYAAQHGGQDWDSAEKEAFANDTTQLLATSAKENRSKGDKGPSDYMPPNDKYKCVYSKTFIATAHKYNLTISQKDKDTLKKTIEKFC